MPHFDGKKTAGRHTTVIDGAAPVVDLLRKVFPTIRITNDLIQSNIKARSFSVKLSNESGAKKMTVVTNGSKQDFYLFDAPDVETLASKLRAEKKLRAYFINT